MGFSAICFCHKDLLIRKLSGKSEKKSAVQCSGPLSNTEMRCSMVHDLYSTMFSAIFYKMSPLVTQPFINEFTLIGKNLNIIAILPLRW